MNPEEVEMWTRCVRASVQNPVTWFPLERRAKERRGGEKGRGQREKEIERK